MIKEKLYTQVQKKTSAPKRNKRMSLAAALVVADRKLSVTQP